ncbi:TRAP transporter small permease subunit [uncultured Roseibium sp.]|uniref:TRAP transporter small permease n=1 Tax=uncultured Roseibium sp. TaxID=1936171 RepID=UPI0032167283
MGGGTLTGGPAANGFSRWLARVETGLVALSTLAMAAIMCIVVVDVLMRYAFAAPLAWSYDLIGLYLVSAVFFLALPDTMHHHGHIALDVFAPMMPAKLRHTLQSLGYGVSSALIAAITWLEFQQAETAFLADQRIASVIPWPTWIAHAVLTVGMAVLFLRCGYRAVFHLASAITGRDLVEVPPPPITEDNTAWRAE